MEIGYNFNIQFRSEGLDESKVPLYTDRPLLVAINFPIIYCPYCGKRLDKWYRRIDLSLIREDLEIGEL